MKLNSVGMNIADQIRLRSGKHVSDRVYLNVISSVYYQIRFNGRRVVMSEIRDQIRRQVRNES
jgi:hypothetical protein